MAPARSSPAVAVIATGPGRLVRACTTTLEDVSGLRTHVLTADSAHAAAAALSSVGEPVGAVVLPHADRAFGAEVTSLTGTPAVTGADTTAIALAATVATTLARAGRPARSGHVVIAGADTLPLLFTLVMLAETGQVTQWTLADAQAFPLHHVAAGADAVVDLVGAMSPGTHPAVITPDPDRDPLLALPGLVRALMAAPHAPLDVEVHQACVLAMVMATRPTRTRPDGQDRARCAAVAAAATSALRRTGARTGGQPRRTATEPDRGGS